MEAHEDDIKITVRDLQRNAAAVLKRLEHGETISVTRHGRTVARIIPPDPAEEAINQAVSDGLIDLTELSRARTAAQTARIRTAPSAPGETPLSQTLTELRDEDSDR
ncbi:type II toxin-antitoxin system Phd/YefM family antitoxin [Streptomyces himalayensis]|uniref:Type II toxin-antitoxin system prevent-host-death family antitoxin n=1 Tax=Streptomyces himalayensis subsp. himalayensis TaxID=2756131 RepID=A0A7W0I982_9ACTN|nr:type II toxin-antitoxin system prevent-host-death family antitoxin [Streptomyces himalayensis]MBA2947117.1 type II toxin-antitoxin system prevent-host-death family antitoxin [Streptomyces himalayensis subsp. himalayensis]